MTKFQLSIAACFFFSGGLLSAEEIFVSSAGKSIESGIQNKITAQLEKSKAEIEFCIKNRGRGFAEIDISKIGSLGAYDMGINVITDGLIASKYELYGDYSKAADYYYKDYLVQEGKRTWISRYNWGSPGDSTPFPMVMSVLKENQDYKRMLKLYPEYFDYYFFADTNRYKGSREEKLKTLKKQIQEDGELKDAYDNFMSEWEDIKRLSKTSNPKPLDTAVQHHEWFYSDKSEEVMKALDYYHANKVGFMLEKALSHKDPKVAGKAKEYLEDLKKGEKNEPVKN